MFHQILRPILTNNQRLTSSPVAGMNTGTLLLTQLPSNGMAILELSPSPIVTVWTTSGVVDLAYEGEVILNVWSGGVLSMEVPVDAVAGIATFTGIILPVGPCTVRVFRPQGPTLGIFLET